MGEWEVWELGGGINYRNWCLRGGEARVSLCLEVLLEVWRLYFDRLAIYRALHLVDNNGPDSVGGGGRRRRSLHSAPTDLWRVEKHNESRGRVRGREQNEHGLVAVLRLVSIGPSRGAQRV